MPFLKLTENHLVDVDEIREVEYTPTRSLPPGSLPRLRVLLKTGVPIDLQGDDADRIRETFGKAATIVDPAVDMDIFPVVTSDPPGEEIAIVKQVTPDGNPFVALVISKRHPAMRTVMLNANPAWLISLAPDSDNPENGLLNLGFKLAEAWDQAKKMADDQKGK